MQLNAEAGLGWHLIDWKGQGFSAVMDAHAPPLRIFSQGCVDRQTCFFFLSFSFYLKSLEAVKGVILRLDK